jgi:tRNA modification GTPase
MNAGGYVFMAKDLRSDEMDYEDTISAVATAVGEGGIGIVRVSGPQAITIAEKLFCSATSKTLADAPGHSALYGHVVEPDTRECIDETLLLIMRAPHSYTCEDVVEFQCHGGVVPLRKVLEATLKMGARLAEPGEFTKRAFLNGRIDLTQAEAVMDIIRSKTAASLQVAIKHLSGNLSQQIKEIRQALLTMIAHLEAAIDFPEEDIEELSAGQVKEGLEPVLSKISKLVSSAHSGRILREGLKTVIIGKPNVGKSSLLNALLKENRAIVTSIAGTTRDSIEECVNVQGIPLNIIDTAGIRETDDIVEKLGVAKSRELVGGADLILVILDSSVPLTPEDRQVIDLTKSQHGFVLLNKSDLPAQLAVDEVKGLVGQWPIISLSLETGEGLAELEQSIVDEVYEGQISSEAVYVNNVRHVHCLNQAQQQLQSALHTIDQAMPIDCIVVDLRGAWEILGEITGDTVGEDLLDQIFSQFCIGK